MRRSRPNKRQSVRNFNRGHSKSHVNNRTIMRGGWRL